MEAGVTWVSFGMMRVLEKQRLAEGEALKRQRVVAWRAEAGDRHPGTIGALANLAANLQEQRKNSRQAQRRSRTVLRHARKIIVLLFSSLFVGPGQRDPLYIVPPKASRLLLFGEVRGKHAIAMTAPSTPKL